MKELKATVIKVSPGKVRIGIPPNVEVDYKTDLPLSLGQVVWVGFNFYENKIGSIFLTRGQEASPPRLIPEPTTNKEQDEATYGVVTEQEYPEVFEEE